MAEPPRTFDAELTSLISSYSREGGSDTPDYILAAYLERCLLNFNETLTERTRWYTPHEVEQDALYQQEGESK